MSLLNKKTSEKTSLLRPFLQKKLLKLEIGDESGRVIFEDYIDQKGDYALCISESPYLKIQARPLNEEGGFGLRWTKSRFLIRLPKGVSYSVDSSENLSAPTENSRLELFWSQVPSHFQIKLQNGYQLRITESLASPFRLNKKKVWAASLAAGFMINVAFLAMSLSIEPKSLESTRYDLAQVQVRVVGLNPAPTRSTSGAKVSAERRAQINKLKGIMRAASLDELMKEKPQAKAVALDSQLNERQEELMADSEVGEFFDEAVTESETELNLDSQYLSQRFKDVNRKLEVCFSDILIRDRNLEGNPLLSVEFNENGRATQVSVDGMNAKASSLQFLESCFLKAFQSLQLKKPNQAFRVTRSMILQQGKTRI